MSTEEFKSARDLLLALGENYDFARAGFKWPRPKRFNWALDWFDAELASGEHGARPALKILGDDANKPLVVRLDGNNVDEGRRILAEANHPLVTVVATMDEAADKAAELANA